MPKLAPPPVRTPPRVAPSPPASSSPAPSSPGFPTPAMIAAVGDPQEGTLISEADYERLVTEYRTEWVGGRIEYLPMNSDLHHSILSFLYDALREGLAGRTPRPCLRFAGIGVRVPHRIREPDLALLLDEDDPRRTALAWNGADFVAEVVSDDDPPRDLVRKRAEYAAAGIPEYWIVDPRPRFRTISVLTLDGAAYRDADYREGETAVSVLLPGFAVDVTACLSAR